MAEIWRRILGLEETAIGINDDFFQIGGNSLNAVRFVSEIESKFGVGIPILYIFTEPRIKDLSKYIYRCFKDREESPLLLLNQPQGAYLLFGYSTGGNHAFEMAKELERRNNIVSELIPLESL
jgi:acyl carrier protein